MLALLKEAFNPNLVQTLEHTPALVHGGPFANIAHGCNSLVATKLAMKLGDWTVTEAGFGADLGAEKFIDIKCRVGDISPNVVVLVATIRSLKYNGGAKLANLNVEDMSALEKGSKNLLRHISNLKKVFNTNVVVALNSFESDTEREVDFLSRIVEATDTPIATSEGFLKGSEGTLRLAKKVISTATNPVNKTLNFAYDLNSSIVERIEAVATKVYGAKAVNITPKCLKTIKQLEGEGSSNLPICIAKTQYSFSDDKDKLGAPEDFEITINDIQPCYGAGFIVAIAGNIMRMPGLPKVPAANNVDVDSAGQISGIF
jgi:formate--tetrahydrofolate ligase